MYHPHVTRNEEDLQTLTYIISVIYNELECSDRKTYTYNPTGKGLTTNFLSILGDRLMIPENVCTPKTSGRVEGLWSRTYEKP